MDDVYVLAVEHAAGEHSALYRYNLRSQNLVKLEITPLSHDLHSDAIVTRMKCDLPISFEYNAKQGTILNLIWLLFLS